MFLLLCSALIFGDSSGNTTSEVSAIENVLIIWFSICVLLSIINAISTYRQWGASKLEDEELHDTLAKAQSRLSPKEFATSQFGDVTVTKNPVNTTSQPASSNLL
jgi:hypothetical protein